MRIGRMFRLGCIALSLTLLGCSFGGARDGRIEYPDFSWVSAGETKIDEVLERVGNPWRVDANESNWSRYLFLGDPGPINWDVSRFGPAPAAVAVDNVGQSAILIVNPRGVVADWAYLGRDGFKRLDEPPR